MELRKLIENTILELDKLAKEKIDIPSDASYGKKNSLEKKIQKDSKKALKDEVEFLEELKERVEVLFLGLQTKQIVNLEDKLDMTLRFLEYLLANVQKRLDALKDKKS